MYLSELIDEFIAAREPSGFMLERTQVVAYAVAAVRFYMGWACLQDETVEALDDVAEGTDLTAGEWAIIGPLFTLYVERQVALVVESSRGLGVDPPGRSTSEVESAIQATEQALPQLAYSEPSFLVGAGC